MRRLLVDGVKYARRRRRGSFGDMSAMTARVECARIRRVRGMLRGWWRKTTTAGMAMRTTYGPEAPVARGAMTGC